MRGRRSANRADCPPGVDRTEYFRAREKWSKRAEMRDTLSGVLPLSDRVKAQHHHKTMWNTLTTTKSTSSHPVHLVESHTFQIACVSGLLEGHSIPTNPNCFTSILDLTLELGCAIAYLSPDRSTPRGPRHLCDPFVKDRHTSHQAFTDSCTAPRCSQKAFFHFFATLFRQHSSGISLVHPKFHPAPDVST